MSIFFLTVVNNLDELFLCVLYAALVGTPSAPFVVSMESITNTSFDISWLPASHEAVMYKLQWKYVDIEGSIWTSYNIQVNCGLTLLLSDQ